MDNLNAGGEKREAGGGRREARGERDEKREATTKNLSDSRFSDLMILLIK